MLQVADKRLADVLGQRLKGCFEFMRRFFQNNVTFIMRLKLAMQTQRRWSLHIGKTHDQHLEACCRGISSC